MLRTVLVDDEILVLNHLERVIGETNEMEVIGTFTEPEKALIEIPKLSPDVLFLDVDMPGMNGIKLGTKLMESNECENMSIVFVTAYEQYAIRAFELNAIHYVLKPADVQSLEEIVKRVNRKNRIKEKKNKETGEFSCFGNMRFRVGGNPVDFLTPKIEELLALFILHREKGINKWRIIDILWEESSIEKSQQNLYTMIFRLKQTLRNAGINIEIKSKNGIYRMDLAGVRCDLMEFDRVMGLGLSVDQPNIDAYEQAISLYQGDLLEDKDYLWCIPIRENYYQQFLYAVTKAAEYYAGNRNSTKLRRLYQKVRHLLIEEDYEQFKK